MRVLLIHDDLITEICLKKMDHSLIDLLNINLNLENKLEKTTNFIKDIRCKTIKDEWIYIASSDEYQLKGVYKIGSTENLEKRIKIYQTGRLENFYYIWHRKCYNSKNLDNFIGQQLKDFKYKSRKELYCGIYIYDLIDIVTFICDNYDKTTEYICKFIKSKLPDSLSKKKIIIKQVDSDQFYENFIKNSIESYLETITNNKIIKRKELLSSINCSSINEKEKWKIIKQILNWKNSSTKIVYKDKLFYLFYN